MKVSIVTVPYITSKLHLQFAEEALQSFQSKEHTLDSIAVVNNWRADDSNTLDTYYDTIIQNDENCLSKAWNQGIDLATQRYADYILIPNLDVVFSKNTIDNLVKFAEEHPEADLWTASETRNKDNIDAECNDGFAESPHFSCFMIKPELVLKLYELEVDTPEPKPGYFDENIKPAYHEDGDYHRRMKLKGLTALRTATSMFYHYGSRTIRASDDPVRAEINLGSANTRGYYMLKWGGLPGSEIFNTAFGDK